MIDPNEAPEGYVAVMGAKNSCAGCVFSGGNSCSTLGCQPYERKDRQSVIFIKREEVPAPAAYSAAQVREILFVTFDTLHRLRNYFAGKALQGLLADHTNNPRVETLAWQAYTAADAMLAAKFATMTWGKK